ncbi:hypothetical protein [Methylobacterium sp. 37f]|uniref:hypothetical protein n=1 Tax=Methylobacterium sp. 37f TaxID=2817058 RepID=UPI001FFD2B38|nr:hypothetical protein [Methylobacterium sp. 37f]MCK2056373.1 hypothetical protein [Methylobacterium sp. 37f]
MTASVKPKRSSNTCEGRLFDFGSDWVLCSFRLPTSMPIPLAVVAPSNISLETWAFTGMTSRANRPICLMLLRVEDAEARASLAREMRLVVATHFHLITVATTPTEPADGIDLNDQKVMAEAVLSAVTPRNARALADPIALLAPTLRAVPLPKSAPEIMLGPEPTEACTVSGTDVPNYILFDADAGLRLTRVATARLIFSPIPRMDLDLEPLWGAKIELPQRTFLVGHGRFTTARLRTGTA